MILMEQRAKLCSLTARASTFQTMGEIALSSTDLCVSAQVLNEQGYFTKRVFILDGALKLHESHPLA